MCVCVFQFKKISACESETAIIGRRRMKTEEKQKLALLFGGHNYLFIYSIPCHASNRPILKKMLNSSFSLKGQCHKIFDMFYFMNRSL